MTSILKSYNPSVFEHLNTLADEAVKEGALSIRVKEPMAIGLSIASGCEPCIKIHTRRALKHGASREEIAETIGVAVLLLGGPADVWPAQIIADEIQKVNTK
jgi:AhpD family alkylhydroperoxidase